MPWHAAAVTVVAVVTASAAAASMVVALAAVFMAAASVASVVVALPAAALVAASVAAALAGADTATMAARAMGGARTATAGRAVTLTIDTATSSVGRCPWIADTGCTSPFCFIWPSLDDVKKEQVSDQATISKFSDKLVEGEGIVSLLADGIPIGREACEARERSASEDAP